MALTFTQTDLDNLKAALVSGVKRVQIGDRLVEYNSMDDLLKAIQIVQSYLDGVPSETPNVVQASYSRGAR